MLPLLGRSGETGEIGGRKWLLLLLLLSCVVGAACDALRFAALRMSLYVTGPCDDRCCFGCCCGGGGVGMSTSLSSSSMCSSSRSSSCSAVATLLDPATGDFCDAMAGLLRFRTRLSVRCMERNIAVGVFGVRGVDPAFMVLLPPSSSLDTERRPSLPPAVVVLFSSEYVLPLAKGSILRKGGRFLMAENVAVEALVGVDVVVVEGVDKPDEGGGWARRKLPRLGFGDAVAAGVADVVVEIDVVDVRLVSGGDRECEGEDVDDEDETTVSALLSRRAAPVGWLAADVRRRSGDTSMMAGLPTYVKETARAVISWLRRLPTGDLGPVVVISAVEVSEPFSSSSSVKSE